MWGQMGESFIPKQPHCSNSTQKAGNIHTHALNSNLSSYANNKVTLYKQAHALSERCKNQLMQQRMQQRMQQSEVVTGSNPITVGAAHQKHTHTPHACNHITQPQTHATEAAVSMHPWSGPFCVKGPPLAVW
jgi:hypothetical protein